VCPQETRTTSRSFAAPAGLAEAQSRQTPTKALITVDASR